MKIEKRSRSRISLHLALPLLMLLCFSACGEDSPQTSALPILGAKIPQGGDTLYHQIGDFQFSDQNGELVSQDFYKGKIWVADVFFTTCPGIGGRSHCGGYEGQQRWGQQPGPKASLLANKTRMRVS